MGVKELVQVGHHQALEVEAAVGPAVLDSLDSGGDTLKDAHLVTSEVKLTALEVGHLKAEFPHQVVVDEVDVWSGKDVGDQGGSW